MESFAQVAHWVGVVLFVALALVTVRIWFRRRTRASAWVAAAFVDLAAFVLVGDALPEEGLVADVGGSLMVLGVVLFPYFLYRFAVVFRPPGRTLRWVADGATAVVGLAVVVLPLEPDRWWFLPVAVSVGGLWVFLFTVVGIRLYRGGRGQPTLARRRMRLLSLGAFLMGAAIILALLGSPGVREAAGPGDAPAAGEDASDLSVFANLLAAVSAGVFVLGFAPPDTLRAAWRQPEEQDLHRAALRLLAATSHREVTETLLPHLASVVGAEGVTIKDDLGRTVGAWGTPVPEVDGPSVMHLPLRSGQILVAMSPYTPFFGAEEQQLLRRLGVLADLALDRVGLLDQLRDANEALEEANAELESFVYSASHDLKNPLIAVLGYLDVVQTDYGDVFDEQGKWYLGRMVTNMRFMESLIQDLLELSRIGRVEVEPSRVELGRLVDDLAADQGRFAPHLSITAAGLPTLWMNRTRLRQLFANIFENAAKYGGRPEVTVSLWSEPTPTGGVRIHVADDGVGISEEYHEKVFGMFERLESDDTKTAGTGIGLALCRRIAETVGGNLELVPSEVGAHLVLTLPHHTVIGSPGEPPSERLVEARP